MRHQTISFIKSAVRMFGYGILPWSIFGAALILIGSEVIGVLEEIGHE